MALAGWLVEDVAKLEAYRDEWDALAVAARRPYCAPAWMLGWWRNARPKGERLRAVVARDGGRLVGIAPFCFQPRSGRYQLLGGGLAGRVEPLAHRGREPDVARVFGSTLEEAGATPTFIRLEAQSERPGWARLLADSWPRSRRAWVHCTFRAPAPCLALGSLDYESWLRAKSRNFRQRARRLERRLLQNGAEFRTAGVCDLEPDLEAFSRLHHARWQGRGGSTALDGGVQRMLRDTGRELIGSGRFRLFSIEVDSQIVSSHLFVAAGGELAYWNGGFDEAWSEYSPAFQSLLYAVRDAMERGDSRVDLGPGGQHYKYRLADGEELLESFTLVPKGSQYPLTRLRLAPHQARWALSRHLSQHTKDRLRRMLPR